MPEGIKKDLWLSWGIFQITVRLINLSNFAINAPLKKLRFFLSLFYELSTESSEFFK